MMTPIVTGGANIVLLHYRLLVCLQRVEGWTGDWTRVIQKKVTERPTSSRKGYIAFYSSFFDRNAS